MSKRPVNFADALDQLAAARPDLTLRQQVPWNEATTLGAGAAPIPLLAEADSEEALAALLELCAAHHQPVLCLGAGSNLVGCDHALPGLALRLGPGLARITCTPDGLVTAGAGARLNELVRTAAVAGFGGLAPLVAIPGTVGGALRMNSGAENVAIGQFVHLVSGRRLDGKPWQATGAEITWGNRSSSIPDDVLLVGVALRLPPADTREEQSRIEKVLRRRRGHDPRGRTAGCAFRNPAPELPAGQLLDQVGAKGLRAGAAMLSELHANWLMNDGCASEADTIELLRLARRRVVVRSGIYLNLEVRFANPESGQRIHASPQPLRVAVLKGGASSERKVSLESGAAVAGALRRAGYTVTEFDLRRLDLPRELHDFDVIFPVLHGGFGENGELQARLTAAGLPFVGCDPETCRTVFDKVLAKEVMLREGIPTPAYAILGPDEQQLPPDLPLPVVTKPPDEGSTVGVSIVTRPEELPAALALARKSNRERVLVEQYISGREITVGVLGDQALPLVEIQYPGKMYDYDAKYTHACGETLYHCPPATIPNEVQRRAQAIALAFARAVGARDMIRVDLLVRHGDDALFVLEGNNIPGFTASSLLPKAARASGIEFPELCGRLVQMAWRRAHPEATED